MVNRKLSSLVLDFDLYPRSQIDTQHVASMVEAEKAGTRFPPLTIDKKSKRIIDGFHRYRKELVVHGSGGTIPCVEKTYRNEAEMLLDAARLNSGHGRGLSSSDKTRVALLAVKQKLAADDVAAALCLTRTKLDGLLTTKTAIGAKEDGGEPVVLKRTIQHMAGRDLTHKQGEANRKLGGMNQIFYIDQLLLLLESDLVDRNNDLLFERLKRLAELLEGLLAAK